MDKTADLAAAAEALPSDASALAAALAAGLTPHPWPSVALACRTPCIEVLATG